MDEVVGGKSSVFVSGTRVYESKYRMRAFRMPSCVMTASERCCQGCYQGIQGKSGTFIFNQGKRKIFLKIKENQESFRVTIVSY